MRESFVHAKTQRYKGIQLFLGMIFFAVTSFAQVNYERIRSSELEPQNWLTYSGNFQSHRFSSLTQINKTNVAQLKPVWVYQMRDPGKVETTPLVVDGILYISEKPHVVTALDGRTGRPLWTYRRTTPADARGCCGTPNRGLAVLNDTLYLCTFDGERRTRHCVTRFVISYHNVPFRLAGMNIERDEMRIKGA